MRGGAFFNGKEGRDDFRTMITTHPGEEQVFFLQRANKQLSILLGYDIAIQALNYNLAFIGCMNHAVITFIQEDIIPSSRPYDTL